MRNASQRVKTRSPENNSVDSVAHFPLWTHVYGEGVAFSRGTQDFALRIRGASLLRASSSGLSVGLLAAARLSIGLSLCRYFMCKVTNV